MLRLLEITFTDKESVALYPTEGQSPYADETALTADFDTKMGQAMKSDAYKTELLVAFDHTGEIYAQGYNAKMIQKVDGEGNPVVDKDGNPVMVEEAPLSPRLVWVTATSQGETADQSKKNDMNTLEADFYIKRGAAKKNNDVLAILNLGVNGKSVVINDYWVRPIEPAQV